MTINLYNELRRGLEFKSITSSFSPLMAPGPMTFELKINIVKSLLYTKPYSVHVIRSVKQGEVLLSSKLLSFLYTVCENSFCTRSLKFFTPFLQPQCLVCQIILFFLCLLIKYCLVSRYPRKGRLGLKLTFHSLPKKDHRFPHPV